ncbi:MAG TPA: amidohydrolase family protein [Candidatus Angelobacter sp.]|nr:amidohydrolase family protein [Candidatus Angelobacter sp.]
MTKRLPGILCLTVGCWLTVWCAAQQQSPLPELPADIPQNADMRMLLTDKTPSGQDAVWTTPDGVMHEFFQFNDRGRGPKTYSTFRLDQKALITSEEVKGVDYMKTPIEEHFSFDSGTARWKNQGEDEHQENAAGKFYVDLNGGPESGVLLVRALLRSKNGRMPLLPSGEARLRKLQSLDIDSGGKTLKVTLYAVDGLSMTPIYLWMDADQQFFANIFGDWSALIRKGFESSVPALHKAQLEVETARAAELAKKLTHKPTGDLIVKNVNVFDSTKSAVIAKQRVTVRGERIVSVESEQGQHAPAGAEVIDGSGKTLLPGLWDMHSHLFPQSAYLNIAAGVTTVRDLGNPIDDLTRLRGDIEAGRQIGPRVVRAGFIDGPGPFEGPIKVLAATPEEAKQRVDHYAELGYVQIKIYSSVKPELVPLIAAEAHKLGMRVSGHVPSGMIAEQFVRDGADEIQHMNFIFLNFMPDVKETRTPARFIEPGKRAGDLDLNSAPVNDFIAFLKAHHTVVDPTMATWEDTYVDRPGKPLLSDAYMFDRLPVQVQRGSMTGGGALGASDPAVDKQYRACYANMVRMVKKLYDSGIQLVAGTDQGSGYALHRELEIYAQAGIPAPEVLRMATLEAAEVMHLDRDFGSITSGKFADMILVNGNPAANISDIRKIDVVVKGGAVYRPAELYPEFGIRGQ